ncbi:hypothetical protein SRABI128_06425 [Microbacterium sp. Bi128]|nr:hypothetical protein SRABI128_06425 [Microbacterium sp. Bi128]
MGDEFGDFLARDRRVRLGGDVPVQEQAQAEQDDGLDPAQGTLLAQDTGTRTAADRLGVNRAQDGDLALVVQLQREEEFGEAAAQDQLVVQERGPQLFVAAAVDVGALEQLHERLPHLHGQHAGVAGEERGAVDERVPGGDDEGVAADVGAIAVRGRRLGRGLRVRRRGLCQGLGRGLGQGLCRGLCQGLGHSLFSHGQSFASVTTGR